MPRITEVIHFLTKDKFDSIPPFRLDAARDKGIKNHKRFEDYFKLSMAQRKAFPLHTLEGLFHQSLKLLPSFRKCDVEVRLHKGDLNGQPDLVTSSLIDDYKFRLDRPDEGALQLCGYEYLVGDERRLFLHHIPNDTIIKVYEVNPKAKPILLSFYLKCYKAHEALKTNDFLKYDLMYEWEQIKASTLIWLPVGTSLPANTLRDLDLDAANIIAERLDALAEYKKMVDFTKSELLRWMLDNNVPSLGTDKVIYTVVRKMLPKFKVPPADKARMKAIKDKHMTGKEPSIYLITTKI